VPRIEASATVAVSPEVAFAVSQSQGELRYRWDPFVREQRLLDGATRPGKGVRTFTRSRHGLTMVSEYLAFNPPRQVGMRMVTGPWFFRTFSGGWGFGTRDDGGTDVTWRYSFGVRPRWLAPVADRLGRRFLQRDIERRLAGFVRACGDAGLVAEILAVVAEEPAE
jgi:Polyketide cyclase / dehydrase and lipid transport